MHVWCSLASYSCSEQCSFYTADVRKLGARARGHCVRCHRYKSSKSRCSSCYQANSVKALSRTLIHHLHATTDCQTRCTTGWMSVYTIQPVAKTGLTTVSNEQPLFVQSVVKLGCTTGCIYDTDGCQTGLTTSWMLVYTIQPVTGLTTCLTTGCIV